MAPFALPAGATTGSVALVGAVEWSSTVNIGAIALGLLVALSTVVAVSYGARYKVVAEAASAAARELRSALDDALARGERQDRALCEQSQRLEEQAHVIERLEHLPNLERVVNLMAEEAKRADDRATKLLHEVEERAQKRHEAQIAALAGIAETLEQIHRSQPKGI